MLIINIIYIFFIINILIQLGYWGAFFSKFYTPKTPIPFEKQALPPLSILICAKNEAENLRSHLLHILQQNYKTFEVIVVNDGSDDDSSAVLAAFANEFAHLHLIYIDKNSPKILQGKKQALTAGIAAAHYDWVLVTDADCRPRSEYWAAEMMQTAMAENKKIVLGYSPYFEKSGFLNIWVRLETIYTALQYISFARWGLPYMGVGRNMLYQKSLFLENGGVAAHGDLPSGDDDLFVRDVATAQNTTVCLSANAFVDSAPKTNWRAYAKQKTRHLSTSVRYKPLIQLLLAALSVSHLLVWFLGVFLMILCILNYKLCISGSYTLSYTHFIFLILLLLLRFGVQIRRLRTVMRLLYEKNIGIYLFLFDFMLFLYLFVMSFSFLQKGKKW